DPGGDSPTPGAPAFGDCYVVMRATPAVSVAAAPAAARRAGIAPVVLSDRFTGAAGALAAMHAEIAMAAVARGLPAAPPLVLLSGGEVTVDVTGNGLGGPNGEFALALALALQGAPQVAALACDTDGADGPSGFAGAFVLPDSLARAAAIGRDPGAAMADNDSYGLFDALGDALRTGPSHTNVNDFRAVLVLPPAEA
ncbi:MAG: MOFRL family protein, partial [Sneathiellaceae bacterium]